MKNITVKKSISVLSAFLVVSLSFAAFPACNRKEKTSELIGKFTNVSDTEVVLTNDSDKIEQGFTEDGKPYIYTSDIYPLNTIGEESVVYSASQTLRLKRDYTYEYAYDILLRKVTQDGNTDLAKIAVTANGEFEYKQVDESDTDYNVTLNTPTGGQELRYGSSIADEGNIYSWRLSPAPNYRLNIENIINNEETIFDRYVAGRQVSVERGEEKVLYDNIFYNDVLEDIAPFCSFASVSAPIEQPDDITPPPENPEPSQTVSYADMPQTTVNGVGVSMRVGENLSLIFKTKSDVSSVIVNGSEINSIKENIFEYPLEYSALDEKIEVVAKDSSFTVLPADYLKNFISAEGEQTLYQKAVEALAISILNAADVFGADTILTAEQYALVYESLNNNKYHTDWGARDNITEQDVDNKVEGFVWEGLPALETKGGTALTYSFSVNSGDYLNLNSKITVGDGKTYSAEVKEISSAGGKTYYKLTTKSISPVDFCNPVAVEICDGNNKISSKAIYSVNRAVAKADLSENEQTKNISKALYSLGKSVIWYLNRETATYSYLPPVNGAGRYELVIDEYNYNDGRMAIAAQSYAVSGSSLYLDGTVTSDIMKENLGLGYTVNKVGERFFVTLGGAEIDGICAADSSTKAVTVTLKGASAINNVLLPQSGDRTPAASVKTLCDLTIKGDNGTVLDIYGNIYVNGTLTIEGVTVNVHGSLNASAVVCEDLFILDGGGLNVKTSLTGNTADGIYASGNISVDGTLSSEGYKNGIYLAGDSAQRLTVYGGKLNVSAADYGITGVGTTAEKVNRQLVFNGGESYVRAASGVRYGDISVGDASLTVIADVGYTVEADNPVTIRTTSGDFRKGSLNLINNAYNPWWDVNYTIKIDNLLLNGGSVHIFGMCKDGVVHTETGATISVENCDLTIENGQNLKDSYGRGLNLNSGDEKIDITNSAKVIFVNCDSAVNCYGKAEQAKNYAEFNNYGLIILDTYKCHLLPWNGDNNVVSWEMRITVNNDGEVRTTNYIG